MIVTPTPDLVLDVLQAADPVTQRAATAKLDAFLREHDGIDSALLAADVGISRITIESYQRHLGLRKCESSK